MRLLVVSLSLLAWLILPQRSWAGFVTEVGDAGQLLADAQVTQGTDTLERITGTISSNFEDIDLYQVRIGADASAFSVELHPIFPFLDPTLFLFDGTGRGIAAIDAFALENEKIDFSVSTYGLSGGETLFIGVSTFTDLPQSSSGSIFPSLVPGVVVEANGPGSADPLSGWALDSFQADSGDYEITFTGAEFAQSSSVVVPVPSGLSLVIVGFCCLFPAMLARFRRWPGNGHPANPTA